MVWTTPLDWSGIASDIVTSVQLNQQIRDNLSALSIHAHTGVAGDGASSIAGVGMTAIPTLTFADQSANPDAAGELQRNGNDLVFYGVAAVNLTQSNASAGTASLRTLDQSSATAAAAGNHTHTPATPNQLILDSSFSGDTDTESTVATGTIVVQGASEAIAVCATYNFPDGASSNAYTMRLKYSGPTSGTIETRTGLGNTGAAGGVMVISPSNSSTPGIITPATAGTYTITVTVERTSGTTYFNAKAVVYAREVGA
jgi:hypothetical protein